MTTSHKCCVSGCIGTQKPLHKFPNPINDYDRFNQWVLSIGGDIIEYDNGFIYKLRRVCRAHFEEKFLCTGNRLSNIAVPTLNMPDFKDGTLFKYSTDRRPSRFNLSSTENTLCEAKKVAKDPNSIIQLNISNEHSYHDKDDEMVSFSQRGPHKYQNRNENLLHIRETINEDDLGNIDDNDIRTPSPEIEEPEIELNMCRICLQSFSKLISIESYGLRTAYEQLTGVSVEHDDGLPRELCVECATLLDKYHKFRDKSIKGDQLLRQLYSKDQTSKPLEEIEQYINSLASTIDYNPEMTIIDIEPKQMIEQMCQCDMENEIIEQSMQDLEMSVVDDEECYITHDIDTQMMESDNLDQQNSTDNVTAIDSSDNEGFDSPMTKEEELYIVKINRNKILENKLNEEMNSDDDISIKEEEDELADPLHSVELARAQDCNLIEINYDIKRLSSREQVQQHCERRNSPRYLSSRFKCQSCFQGFGTKESYKNHMELLHSLKIGKEKCMMCETRYANNKELESHIEVTHSYSYECKNCKKILFNRLYALRHIKTHVGPLIS